MRRKHRGKHIRYDNQDRGTTADGELKKVRRTKQMQTPDHRTSEVLKCAMHFSLFPTTRPDHITTYRTGLGSCKRRRYILSTGQHRPVLNRYCGPRPCVGTIRTCQYLSHQQFSCNHSTTPQSFHDVSELFMQCLSLQKHVRMNRPSLRIHHKCVIHRLVGRVMYRRSDYSSPFELLLFRPPSLGCRFSSLLLHYRYS